VQRIDDRTGLEVLGEDECLHLLGRCPLGRLAVVKDGQAAVFPVNFRRDGRTIVFRTDPGTKLDQVRSGAQVTFEVDEYDPQTRTGWSVIVTGAARDVTEPEDLVAVQRLRLAPWPAGPKTRYVRLEPTRIEGRRVVRLTDAYYASDR
jgi:nitroimidazol reductase NimA-like FMN-containing flavoprotein (pyridoxamine 5'-phosphate oxidase superfamily)